MVPLLFLLVVMVPTPGDLTEPVEYLCRRSVVPPVIDGSLDDPTWLGAEFSAPLVDIVNGAPAWLETRVALAWDDQYLYVAFQLEEPDIQASLTERDSLIYTENDVEFFIAGENAYYELELNALNTIYEVFWIWTDAFRTGSELFGLPEFDRERRRTMRLSGVGGHLHPRGERIGFPDWDFPGLRHAVHLEGTLNQAGDRDRGWSVELALPWSGLAHLADGRSLPPRPQDLWRIDCSRFQKFGPDGRILPTSAGWTWNAHGHYDSHIPERFTRVRFVDEPVSAGP